MSLGKNREFEINSCTACLWRDRINMNRLHDKELANTLFTVFDAVTKYVVSIRGVCHVKAPGLCLVFPD